MYSTCRPTHVTSNFWLPCSPISAHVCTFLSFKRLIKRKIFTTKTSSTVHERIFKFFSISFTKQAWSSALTISYLGYLREINYCVVEKKMCFFFVHLLELDPRLLRLTARLASILKFSRILNNWRMFSASRMRSAADSCKLCSDPLTVSLEIFVEAKASWQRSENGSGRCNRLSSMKFFVLWPDRLMQAVRWCRRSCIHSLKIGLKLKASIASSKYLCSTVSNALLKSTKTTVRGTWCFTE